MTRLLDRAATVYGVEPAFTDNVGRLKIASPDSKRALLAAMGVDASSDNGLREALARQTRAEQAPALIVVQAGADSVIDFAGLSTYQSWHLTLETGESFAGRLGQQADGPNRLMLPAPLPVGYHQLVLERPGRTFTTTVAASPLRCIGPDVLGIDRCYGLACQVYALRTGRDLGSGDLADLAILASAAASAGSDFLALNPLHALFFAAPAQASPYAPSHRSFLNWQLVAPDKVGISSLPDLDAARREARTADPMLVDHKAVATRRRQLLEEAFRRFQQQAAGSPDTDQARSFSRFRAMGGGELARHCLFEALDEQQAATGERQPWWTWPSGLRDPDSHEVASFAARKAERISFFAWLQWQADEQLGQAQEAATTSGMRLGLYRDLAVGVDASGSRAWTAQDLVIREAEIGAPPDEFSPKGQTWGIAPFSPRALEAAGFAPWLADIRANMRHAGALRIDHVMGLRRLFWVPRGGGPADGAYVRYPFSTMAALLALESHRNRCLVIGEDLGTLPRGFRPALRRSGILSCRVLYFERERGGGFSAQRRYRHASVASVGTHDLPTLRGYLQGQDIAWRERLSLFPSPEDGAEARRERAQDRGRLLRLIERAGLLPPDQESPIEDIVVALYRWLSQTPAALLQVQIEDMELAVEQVNLPGTRDEHPNWSRRMRFQPSELVTDDFARRLLTAIAEERPKPPLPTGAAGTREPNARVRG